MTTIVMSPMMKRETKNQADSFKHVTDFMKYLATEPQVKAIKTMAERLGIKVEDAMAIVKTTTIEEINKRDASELIGKMKKMKKK
jgi:arsenate reductase-like glutaredoxin family protein